MPKRTLTRIPDCHPDRKHVSHGLCKQCYNRQYSNKNHDKLLEKQRIWRAENIEASREYGRKWKSKNKEKVKESGRLYRLKNASQILEKHREYNSKNLSVIIEKSKKYRISNPEKVLINKRKSYMKNFEKVSKSNRKRKLRYNYGLTVEEYDTMFKQQGGACAICGETNGDKNLCVDHDHKTGEVRGLLCTSCNSGIGGLKDDIKVVEKAIEYLKRYIKI